jgi:hypothetical protein
LICSDVVKASVDFATKSASPPRSLGKELEFPEPIDMDYNSKAVQTNDKYAVSTDAINKRTLTPEALSTVQSHIKQLRNMAEGGTISIGDAVNLAILEEVV